MFHDPQASGGNIISTRVQLLPRLDSRQALVLFTGWVKKIAALHLVFLLIMSLFRLLAIALYSEKWSAEFWRALLMGLRFDSVVVGYLLVLPSLWLSAMLVLRSGVLAVQFERWAHRYFIAVHSLVTFVLAVDTKYYSYFQDHLNILVFGFIEDDTKALVFTFWRNYPVLWYFFFAVLGVWLWSRFCRSLLRMPQNAGEISSEPLPFWRLPLTAILVLVFVFFLGRGSFGIFPLGPADTVISSNPFVNYLTSNGVHGLYRAFKLRREQSESWDTHLRFYGYSNPKQAFADLYQIPLSQVPEDPLKLLQKRTAKNVWAEKTRPHVVVFMMESFGSYWMSFHSPDFNLLGDLESHFKADILLTHFVSSSNSTTGSLSSIMVSSPQRPFGSFLTESFYLQVPFRSSPARIFSQAGYETHFVYGGNPGWRDINKFAKHQGFEFVEGDVDIAAKFGPPAETHDWGVFDEDVFRYVKNLLNEAQKPQMILVMTTTNHPPYQVPSNFKVPPQQVPQDLATRLVGEKDISAQRFHTYYYSSQKFAEFLSDLKQSKLADKTLVAATGDHNFLMINFSEAELLQKWAVPFYLYAPPELQLKPNSAVFGSHMDIFPTLYHLALSDKAYDSLGVNLFDPSVPHFAIHSAQLIWGPEGAAAVGARERKYFLWNQDLLTQGQPTPKTLTMARHYRSLMAVVDYYFYQEKKLTLGPKSQEK